MAFELRENQGVAFRNDDKANERMPDWRGEFLSESGQKMEWAAWEKEGQRGTFLSFKIGPARERGKRDGGVPF